MGRRSSLREPPPASGQAGEQKACAGKSRVACLWQAGCVRNDVWGGAALYVGAEAPTP